MDLDEIAAQLMRAQDDVASLPAITAAYPDFGVHEAYAVQARIHAARTAAGATAVGRKIGFTNRGIWPTYNVDRPIWAHIYAHGLITAIDAVEVSLATLAEPRIEPEIVLGLDGGLGPGATAADVLDAIGWLGFGFELVQSHFRGWRFAAPDAIADGGLHGALVIGPKLTIHGDRGVLGEALSSFEIELLRGGQLVDVGNGANVLGGPHHAVAHLVAALEELPDAPSLHAGEIITTGTLTNPHMIAAGETWSARFRGLALESFSISF